MHSHVQPLMVRRNAQRQTLLAQQGVAAVAGTVRPDQVLIREMADILFLNRRTGPGNILLSFFQRSADGMHAGNKLPRIAEFFENLFTHAGHRVHIADNVGTVGDFDADFGNRRIYRPHGKGDDVHRASLHASLVKIFHRFLQCIGSNPVIGGSGVNLIGIADIRAVLHTRHIRRIGTEQKTVFSLLQLDRRTAFHHLRHQCVVFLFGTIAPIHFFGCA